MKKIETIAGWIVLIGLGVVISMATSLDGCFNKKIELQNDTITVTDTTHIIDTIPYYDTIPVKPATKKVFIEVPANVDTAEILKNYYATTFRDDTLINDSGLFFRLQQEITQNDVTKQTVELYDFENIKVITKETTIKVPVPAPKYYVGAFTMFGANKAVIGGKLTYKTKKDILISGGYGTGQTVVIDAVIPINRIFTKKQTK